MGIEYVAWYSLVHLRGKGGGDKQIWVDHNKKLGVTEERALSIVQRDHKVWWSFPRV